ncbi:MAG TPA: hypothetical protein VJS42_16595 [Steroidobacteraceae bacterium]|nr:hypothetical protein [Steroidobacteraceae bacterium]
MRKISKQWKFTASTILMFVSCYSWLAGCASQVPQPISQQSVIVVPTAIVATEPQISVAFDLRDVIPFVGLPLNSIARERAEGKLETRLNGFAVQLAELLSSELADRLTANGYMARLIASDRTTQAFIPTFEDAAALPVAPQAEAIVDVVISFWGFTAEGITYDYQPVIGATYRVVDAKTRKVLWRRSLRA